MSKKAKDFNFEEALQELEQVVQLMENGELSLEESLEKFELGIKLTNQCQTALSKAEQKVNKLVENSQEAALVDFEPEQE